jgi:formylglycine-generating enzyme required for sulfatase activity
MALIPAGSFRMGNATNVFPAGEGSSTELPQHTVDVSAFYLDIYEVTKARWDEVKAYSASNGYTFSNAGTGKATNHPVHTVNWYDVVKWCNARSQQDGLTPVYYTDAGFSTVYRTGEVTPYPNWAANGYRLPTEAEWEKAARGGVADTRFPWTDYTNRISWAKANYYGWSSYFSYDLSGGDGAPHPTFATGGYPYTSPVGYFAPNGYGLYGMTGNVREWCWDWYGGYGSSPVSDPRGAASGAYRVLRGGSWYDYAGDARCAFRNYSGPDYEGDVIGFRCARGL